MKAHLDKCGKEKEKPFVCGKCSKGYAHEDDLKNHIATKACTTVKVRIPNVWCEDCGRGYADKKV